MNRLARLILDIRKQLIPYRNEHDIVRGCERWGVDDSDILTSWLASQLETCRRKNRCDAKGMCVFYSYSDLARKNYDICRQMILVLENGEARCSLIEGSEEE
jgi:hypothetical protein